MQLLRPLLCLTLFLCAPLIAADLPPRSEIDAKRDAISKPFAVLDFIGVESGWQAIDLFAGNGYFSEVLANRVGDTGTVYLHNNLAYMRFADKLNDRIAGDRLSNVELYVTEVEDIDLPADSLDMALLVKVYHDVYYVEEGWNVTAGPLFEAILRSLKPGGVLAIIDHHAEPGSGTTHTQNLHRIDAEFAKRDIENRGFKFVGASAILENPQDDLTLSVFADSVKGRTSRFVYKFVKP